MTNGTRDPGWETLRDAWRKDPPATAPSVRPERLRRRVRRESLRLVALAVGEVVFCLLFLGWLIKVTAVDPNPVRIVATATVALFFAVAFTFAWKNRRGLWRSSAATTRAFAELTRRRYLARLREIRFGFRLLAAEVLFFLLWIPWSLSSHSIPAGRGLADAIGSFGLLALLSLGFCLFLSRSRARAKRELAEVDDLLKHLR